ncbi:MULTISPECIES: hypothetical protein [Haloferacaceae]|uniref:Uncharacterized protein n=1 Tax=Halorubrum glutamatedens TaxID=2707018 RepID=A0ABD5QP45_9EURY|nr:hypothetical protein [Halobellus captivus]
MDRPRLTTLLIWSAVGTYLLVALGATAATDAGSAVVAVHHASAVVVGVLLAVTALLAHRTPVSRGVRVGTAAVLIAYLARAGIGLADRTDVVPFDGRIHLPGGIAVFTVLLVTLAVRVERNAGVWTDDRAPSGRTVHSVDCQIGLSDARRERRPDRRTVAFGGCLLRRRFDVVHVVEPASHLQAAAAAKLAVDVGRPDGRIRDREITESTVGHQPWSFGHPGVVIHERVRVWC